MPTTKTKEKKTTTRDEAGVSAAEAAVADEIESMMTQPLGERDRDEPTQSVDNKDENRDNAVDDRSEVFEEVPEQREPDTPQDAPSESEGGTPKQPDEAEDGEAEGEEQADELTEVERLQARSDRYLQLLDNNLKLPPLQDEPSDEMVAQVKPDEVATPAPTFQGIDGASIMEGITDDELYDAKNDLAAERKLWEKVAGRAAAAAVQTSKLGTRGEIEGYHEANRIVEDFMSLEHNMDLRSLKRTVVERGAEIQERNKDIKPSDALDMAGDQVRKHLQMPTVTKTDVKGGPQTTKRIRGAANAVTPMQPRHAGKTGARRGAGKKEEEMSDFDKDVAEIHAAGLRGGFGA